MEQKDLVFLIIGISIFLLIFIGGSILYVLQNRYKKIESLKEKEKAQIIHQQELLNTQLEMQIQTMQHIGREIHDNVGQKLTLASLYAQRLLYENKTPQISDIILSISDFINESLTELRQLSKTLTDDNINNNSIINLLDEACNKVNDLKDCSIHFTCKQNALELNYEQKSILLRIVQEFLQNSIKHAQCKTINVVLELKDNTVILFLEDDGKGFDTSNTSFKGIGLSNMKKRAEMIGGKFILNSKYEVGTSLQIVIPFLG
jgi:signal transduction histidine kinase